MATEVGMKASSTSSRTGARRGAGKQTKLAGVGSEIVGRHGAIAEGGVKVGFNRNEAERWRTALCKAGDAELERWSKGPRGSRKADQGIGEAGVVWYANGAPRAEALCQCGCALP